MDVVSSTTVPVFTDDVVVFAWNAVSPDDDNAWLVLIVLPRRGNSLPVDLITIELLYSEYVV